MVTKVDFFEVNQNELDKLLAPYKGDGLYARIAKEAGCTEEEVHFALKGLRKPKRNKTKLKYANIIEKTREIGSKVQREYFEFAGKLVSA